MRGSQKRQGITGEAVRKSIGSHRDTHETFIGHGWRFQGACWQMLKEVNIEQAKAGAEEGLTSDSGHTRARIEAHAGLCLRMARFANNRRVVRTWYAPRHWNRIPVNYAQRQRMDAQHHTFERSRDHSTSTIFRRPAAFQQPCACPRSCAADRASHCRFFTHAERDRVFLGRSPPWLSLKKEQKPTSHKRRIGITQGRGFHPIGRAACCDSDTGQVIRPRDCASVRSVVAVCICTPQGI